MNLYVQYRPDNGTGKSKFLGRLVPELEKLGVHVQYQPRGCDVTIAFSRFRDEEMVAAKNVPHILRIDGVHMANGKAQKWRNELYRASGKRADLIIWQSDFAKRVAGGILGLDRKNSTTIFNGAPFTTSSESRAARFLVAAKWWDLRNEPRKHKRLNDHISLAIELYYRTGLRTWIAGEIHGKKITDPAIEYLGHLGDAALAAAMRESWVFLYFPWYDWCPNVVVEAMANGCYVVCGNQGGHAEMVQGYGTVVKTDETIEPHMIEKYKVPKLDIAMVANEVERAMGNGGADARNPKIEISVVARSYVEAIRSVM
jgi:glycosyltransferase involved in cell wall biosynthesis